MTKPTGPPRAKRCGPRPAAWGCRSRSGTPSATTSPRSSWSRNWLRARGLRARRSAADGKLHLIAIAGDRSTESSLLRNRGMLRAASEEPRAVVDQVVYADWKRDVAQQMARELYARYPEAALVWAG